MTPDRMIGMDEEDADLFAMHYNYRMVVTRDGDEYYFVTGSCDYDRVLVELDNGIVTEAYHG